MTTSRLQSTASAELSQFRNQIVATTVLDPGANLHLRRTPDAASQSLALIPDGATLVVNGRTAAGGWLQVEYDNTTGWVAGAFVELRLNNRRVTLDDVPGHPVGNRSNYPKRPCPLTRQGRFDSLIGAQGDSRAAHAGLQ